MTRAFAVALAVVLTLFVPAVGIAKPRVAIVTFDGDSQGALQDVVVELIEDDVSLVRPRQVTKAMDKLELDSDMSSKQLKKLAKELEADSIIRGELSSRGPYKLLHVRLFVNGKRVRGFKVEFGSAKSRKFKDALEAKLLDKLGVESEPPPGDDDEAEDESEAEEVVEKPKKKKKKQKKKKTDDEESEDEADGESIGAADGEDDEDPNAGGKKTASRDDEDEDGEDDEEIGNAVEVETGVSRAAGGRAANRAAVRVDFGPSLSSRSLTFTARSFEEAPRPYSNSPVPGGRVQVELYPLAFSKPNSIVGGIGLGGELDQTLSLSVQSTVQMGTKFPVKQNHWSVGGRFRLVFGAKPTSPSVTLAAGYMTRTFQVDRTGLEPGNVIDLPDVGYKGYNAGADIRVGVLPKVAILAGGRGIFVTTTGAIQTAAEYGQAKVTGIDARLGVDIGITKLIAVKITAELAQMGFAFTGTGQMANNRDGDPSTKDVGGAADRYIGGAVTLGVLY